VIEEIEDLAGEGDIEWYNPLSAGFSISGFKHTVLGRLMTTILLYVLETLRLAPKGSSATQAMLCRGADGLVKGGERRIFTPMYFFLATKPVDPAGPPAQGKAAKGKGKK
jgi:sterol 24-C-methyltransferase